MARVARPARDEVAEVIELRMPEPVPTTIKRDAAWRALVGTFTEPLWGWTSRHVDDWGRDNDLTNLVWGLSRLRWDVTVGGAARLPATGAALVVVNTRRYALTPLWTSLALGAAIGRPVRFTGRPSGPGISSGLQRIGALLSVDDDVAGAMRGGQIVVVGAEPASMSRCGRVDDRLIRAAIDAGARIFPAASASSALGRSARIEVGRACSLPKRRGPLQSVELAERVQVDVTKLLRPFTTFGFSSPLELLPDRVWGR